MSFGFSPSDIWTLITLTKQTYDGWRSAGDRFEDITGTLLSFEILLTHIHRRFDVLHTPESPQGKISRQELEQILDGSKSAVSQLSRIAQKHGRLGNWDRLRLGLKDISAPKERLTRNISMLTPFLLVVEMESIGKNMSSIPSTFANMPGLIQGAVTVAFGKMLDRHSQTDDRSSILTTYGDDDKRAYKELRNHLRSLGVKDSDVRVHRSELSTLMASIISTDHKGHSDPLRLRVEPSQQAHRPAQDRGGQHERLEGSEMTTSVPGSDPSQRYTCYGAEMTTTTAHRPRRRESDVGLPRPTNTVKSSVSAKELDGSPHDDSDEDPGTCGNRRDCGVLNSEMQRQERSDNQIPALSRCITHSTSPSINPRDQPQTSMQPPSLTSNTTRATRSVYSESDQINEQVNLSSLQIKGPYQDIAGPRKIPPSPPTIPKTELLSRSTLARAGDSKIRGKSKIDDPRDVESKDEVEDIGKGVERGSINGPLLEYATLKPKHIPASQHHEWSGNIVSKSTSIGLGTFPDEARKAPEAEESDVFSKAPSQLPGDEMNQAGHFPCLLSRREAAGPKSVLSKSQTSEVPHGRQDVVSSEAVSMNPVMIRTNLPDARVNLSGHRRIIEYQSASGSEGSLASSDGDESDDSNNHQDPGQIYRTMRSRPSPSANTPPAHSGYIIEWFRARILGNGIRKARRQMRSQPLHPVHQTPGHPSEGSGEPRASFTGHNPKVPYRHTSRNEVYYSSDDEYTSSDDDYASSDEVYPSSDEGSRISPLTPSVLRRTRSPRVLRFRAENKSRPSPILQHSAPEMMNIIAKELIKSLIYRLRDF